MEIPPVDGRAGKVPRVSEGEIRRVRFTGEVYRYTEGSLDICLIEVAEEVVWREWVGVYGSEIVDVTTRDLVVNLVDVI